MGQLAETFDAYDASATNAEDIHDKIYMVSPEATPVVSAGRRFKATQKNHEWLRDTLAAPSNTNAVIEGDERAGTAITAATRVGNYTQLMDKVAIVSTTQEKSKSIGRSSEMKYQVAKMMTELKRDVEARLVSNLAAVAGNSSTARQTAGLGTMIYTNRSHGTGSPNGSTTAPTGFHTTAPVACGTLRAFAETQIQSVMQSIYTNSGRMPTFISLTPAHKDKFSTFAGIASSRFNVKGKEQATIIGGADVYVSSFGALTVVPNYVQATSNTATAFILHGDAYGVAYLQNFGSVPLAKTGHMTRELVSVEAACVLTDDAAVGKIADLTASGS